MRRRTPDSKPDQTKHFNDKFLNLDHCNWPVVENRTDITTALRAAVKLLGTKVIFMPKYVSAHFMCS